MGLYSRLVFPRLMDWTMSSSELSAQRRDLLAGVGGDVLEIGFGTGLNLAHYPPSVQTIQVVDPNPGMGRLARRRIERSGRRVVHHTLGGESLPLPDASLDSVVSTWTLCSIAEVEQALREVRRVLRPGGRLFFLEHGLSPEPALQRWQRRLTPVQKRLGDGCHLDRDIEGLIRGSGLHVERLERFYMKRIPKIFGFLYKGTATR